jgi:drug/metabolite transporter (DMT)-like permease
MPLVSDKKSLTTEDCRKRLPLLHALAGLQFTYFYAISKIQVAAAILLQYQAPIFIALYGIVFSFEKITARVMVALLGAIFGCYLVVGAQSIDLLSLNRAGILAGISSAICFAWYSITSEYGMRKYKPWSVLFYALFFAAVIWNIFHPPLEAFRHKYNIWQWWWILFISVFGTIIPFGLYNEGINRIRATCASISGTAEPIFAGVISYIFLHERMDVLQALGAAVVIVSIILVQTRKTPLYDARKT